jgi:GT2 family glycosyltransferase
VTTTVTALLVSHDGARWLTAVLDGVTAQTRRPDRVLAVDTGSTDTTAEVLRDRLGPQAVHTAPAETSFGAAVALGLQAAQAGEDDEWVWLLHDDSNPAPDALARLLEAADGDRSVDIVGPKLREWPSLRRLLEVGVTISGTGRRETGLERGEYDQGQHDQVRDVLAVNTAGMLVRRPVLERLGFDERLPVFGNDIDFGWRAARAGHRARVVPEAIVFHAEAARRGARRTPLTTQSPRRAERRAALYTVLANCSGGALPFLALRLFFGSLLRALGFLLVRAPAESVEELGALASVYARPDVIAAARRSRRRSATVPAKDVRHLLAPPWLPYRHGLDFVSDVATALAHQASDMNQARRARIEATETGPVPVEAQNLPDDTGLVARVLTNPVAACLAGLVVLSLVAMRGLIGAGLLSGGGLLPAPGSATYWWTSYLEHWHEIGVGSASPAGPYLLPLAAGATVLLGKAWLLVDVLFLLAVPLAAWGAFRFLRRVTRTRSVSLWGALAYGLLPVLSGAVQGGRLGTVVATLVLPWLAHAALFLGPQESEDRRWRAAWRTSLWLALLAAFVPLAWILATVLALGTLLATRASGRPGRNRRSRWLPVTPVLVSLVLLLPWTVLTWAHAGPSSWLFEAGLPAPSLTEPLSRLDVVLDRPGVAGAPAWLSWGIVLAAVAALLRPDTRRRVLMPWAVIVVALVVTAVLGPGTYALGTNDSGPQPLWLGFPLLVVAAAAITAAALAGTGIRHRLTGASFGWRQPVGLVVVVVALLTPVAGLVWWVVSGDQGGPLDRRTTAAVPTYMTDEAKADPLNGVLVVRGSQQHGFDYVVLRSDGLRLGDDTLLPATATQQPLTALVSRLATAPESSDIAALSAHGVEFVYLPRPADPQLVGNLDSISGMSPASALHRGARAWQVDAAPTGAALPDESGGVRPWLLVVQGLAILTVVVLAAPSREVRR